jgi:exonuclease SbcC
VKIRRLRLAGFGPYRGEQVVDFDRFDEEGLFLITGKTGAGKSSILDAICFALYNTIPRFESRESRPRSHHCTPEDPSFVELDFDVRGTSYRVWRSPEYSRPAKRGGGLTTAKAEARLFRLDGEEWVGLAARAVDVGTELTEILPIKADQFLQVILLAQNRFQRFLLAKTDERRELLRALFGTERFQHLEVALHERRRALDAEVADTRRTIQHLGTVVAEQARIDERVDPDLDWFDAARQGLADQLFTADVAVRDATARVDEAAAALAAQQATLEKQQRRARATAALAALLEHEEETEQAAARVAAARRAAPVWPLLTAQRSAATSSEAAAADAARLAARWQDDHGAEPADLDRLVAETTADLGALRAALADEARLPQLERAATAAAARIADHDASVAALRARAAELPALIAALDAELAPLGEAAATLPDRERDLAAVRELESAARDTERLDAELGDARAALLAASGAATTATAEYDALLQRRFDGMAVELARDLTPGEPCAVCGALEHPAPASSDIPVVEAEHLEAADAEMRRARDRLDAAQASVRELEAAAATSRGRTGGRTATVLAAEGADAEERVTAARAAAARREERQREKQALAAELDDCRSRTDASATERETLVHALSAAQAALDAARAAVGAGRAGAASVAQRTADLETALADARALANARRAAGERAAAATTAEALLAEALEGAGFDDAAALETAHLPAPELDRLAAAVDAHRHQLAAARGQLEDPDLQELPTEPVDVEPARLAAAEARSACDAALGDRASIDARHTLVVAKVIEVQDLVGTSARLLEEHAKVGALAAVVRGDEPNTRRMRLETFVLAGRLEAIIASANQRLATMTAGRYELKLDDEKQFRNAETGLGLGVLDAHTGLVRQPASLSGGEMFLASLSLALGLAEVVSEQAGGIRLDTLFVDEGFGSLDGETLEVAMHALDTLRAGGRTVGVISHVESMRERIPAKLHIRVGPSGDSEILTKEPSAA